MEQLYIQYMWFIFLIVDQTRSIISVRNTEQHMFHLQYRNLQYWAMELIIQYRRGLHSAWGQMWTVWYCYAKPLYRRGHLVVFLSHPLPLTPRREKAMPHTSGGRKTDSSAGKGVVCICRVIDFLNCFLFLLPTRVEVTWVMATWMFYLQR